MNKDHMLVRRTQWDDNGAKLLEWWELYHYSKNWRGKWDWRPKTEQVFNNSGEYRVKISGGRAWADNIAAHYDIKVPEEV